MTPPVATTAAPSHEVLDIFLEEAEEVLANITAAQGQCAQRADDYDALTVIRRGFHTLKGSGRMVGAQLLGEFAWTVENLLNRLINQTLQPTPATSPRPMVAAAIISVRLGPASTWQWLQLWLQR